MFPVGPQQHIATLHCISHFSFYDSMKNLILLLIQIPPPLQGAERCKHADMVRTTKGSILSAINREVLLVRLQFHIGTWNIFAKNNVVQMPHRGYLSSGALLMYTDGSVGEVRPSIYFLHIYMKPLADCHFSWAKSVST